MIEMIRRFLRQRFGNPIVAVTLVVLALLIGVTIVSSGTRAGTSSAFLALVILAARSVSKDASSGALQMILARPLRRTQYLYGRYAGILCAYAAFLVLCGVFAALLAVAALPALRVPTPPFDPRVLLRGLAGSLLGAVLFSAVLLFFSTFLPGYGDVLAYFLVAILLSLPEALGQALKTPWLGDAARVAHQNLLPEVDWDAVLGGQDVLGAPTGRWVLAVVVFLAAAALVFRRREFAYGQD
jgi:ABC-2 family transporter protein